MKLKKGTLLQNGKYRIESVLGQGGFGITYMAYQIGLDRKVAIKEFFMSEFCNRDADMSHVSVPSVGSRETVEKFKAKFIKEAKNIASLNSPHIIKIHDIFEENGTAYYVMEYHEGGSLADLVKIGGSLPEHQSLHYIRQIADALQYIHSRNMNHLDVKPGNVLLDDEGNAVLIDFGLSKRYDAEGNQTSTTPVGISHGYAPFEQYKKGGVGTFSPATDIYSLGATLYKLVTGETPPEADVVGEDGLPPFPKHVSSSIVAAIEKSMQLLRRDRPQSISEFLALLDASSPADRENGEVAVSVVKVDESTVFPGDENESDKKSKVVSVTVDTSGNKTYIVRGVEFKMIVVNGGTFRMGRKSFLSLSDESPVHDVTLSDYYIGEAEVTQELWQAVMGSNPSHFTGNLQRPVENVSWNDCQTFIRKLNELTGGSFRLPTESEWEYAARGGQKSQGYEYSGSNNIYDVAWYWDNSNNTTHHVKAKSPNELGIYDMSGNVWEWCEDWYGDYSSADQTNPKGASSGFYRVNRGGSWYGYATALNCTYRNYSMPTGAYNYLGLRLAM